LSNEPASPRVAHGKLELIKKQNTYRRDLYPEITGALQA